MASVRQEAGLEDCRGPGRSRKDTGIVHYGQHGRTSIGFAPRHSDPALEAADGHPSQPTGTCIWVSASRNAQCGSGRHRDQHQCRFDPSVSNHPRQRSTGTNSGRFQIVESTCQSGALLPRGQCMISVIFTPRDSGDFRGALSVGFGSNFQRESASLSGTGTGFCCSGQQVSQTTRAQCVAKQGAYFNDEASARNACTRVGQVSQSYVLRASENSKWNLRSTR